MAGGSILPACPLLRRLPRAGWRWATCTWLMATCELSCPVWDGGTSGLASPGSLLLHATPKPLGNKGLGRGTGHRGKHAELSSLSQLWGLVARTQARL